jgi:hypothetical protein
MQNYFANETEATHRRREMERNAAIAVLARQARPETRPTSSSQLLHLLLAHFRSLRGPHPLAFIRRATEGAQVVEGHGREGKLYAQTMEGGRASVT